MTAKLTVHLVRHGETSSYDGDEGLTELGRLQARERGRTLARYVGFDQVRFAYAPTVRARQTAQIMQQSLQATAADLRLIGDCVEDPGFRNLQIVAGDDEFEPTQVRHLIPKGGGWTVEAARFWAAHDDGKGDAMQFWLTTPLLWHESPASVVRRMLEATARQTREATDDGHLVVATHSGCLRALVAWIAGKDQGEPDNGEAVRVGLDLEAGRVSVKYRQGSWIVGLPILNNVWPL